MKRFARKNMTDETNRVLDELFELTNSSFFLHLEFAIVSFFTSFIHLLWLHSFIFFPIGFSINFLLMWLLHLSLSMVSKS
ncbi:hypothetical protein [Metabacillus iocasae]|uniref:Uncharacterized protein n=1 Tax=Priestia iocasae TaxID=2291674 RepID=A0ABS2QRH1_9BACI|nr:hypothetical protein [Metabacillus iocasae]MBM7702055.1 hypothetical protein [Metabacillus iocasae]